MAMKEYFLLSIVLAILFEGSFEQGAECDKDNAEKAYPDGEFLIYGVREDLANFMIPSVYFKFNITTTQFSTYLKQDFTRRHETPTNLRADIIVIDGLLYMIAAAQYQGKCGLTSTRIYNVPNFYAGVSMEEKSLSIVRGTKTLPEYLASYQDTFAHPPFISRRPREVIVHQKVLDLGEYYFDFKVQKKLKPRIESRRRTNKKEMRINDIIFCESTKHGENLEKYKILVRKQGVTDMGLECITGTDSNLGISILYKNKDLIKMFHDIAGSQAEYIAERDVEYKHHVGTIFVGARNGYLFSYKITREDEQVVDIINYLNRRYTDKKRHGSLRESEAINILSFDGKEAIVLVTSAEGAWYKVYDVRPRFPNDRMYVTALYKEEMIKIPDVKGKGLKAVYSADSKMTLTLFHAQHNAVQIKADMKENNKAQKLTEAPLDFIDTYTGDAVNYGSRESDWPQQLHNKRTLHFKEQNLILSVLNKAGDKPVTITKFAKYFDKLLYFPKEYIGHTKPVHLKNLEKIKVWYFGIKGCSAFVSSIPDADKYIKGDKSACNKGLKVRALMDHSNMFVLQLQDAKTVLVSRVPMGLQVKEVENCMKNGFVYSEKSFKLNQKITIAPNTFDTIYVVDDELYYQVEPRNECTLKYARAKFSSANDITSTKNFDYSLHAVGKALAEACSPVNWAQYDEYLQEVLYSDGNSFTSENFELFSEYKKPLEKRNIMHTALPYVTEVIKNEKTLKIINVLDSKETGVYDVKYRFVGVYFGYIEYRSAELGKHIILKDEATLYATTKPPEQVTAALERAMLEEAAFIPEPVVESVTFRRKVCKTADAPYFLTLLIKLGAIDLLLLLLIIILVLCHRIIIIPARRRYKIKMGIARHQKKRTLKKRALRRLKRLRFQKKKEERERKLREQKQTQEMLMAVSAAAAGKGGAAKKQGDSGSSSSEMITAGGGVEIATPGTAAGGGTTPGVSPGTAPTN